MRPSIEELLQRGIQLAPAIDPIELSVREARGCVLADAAKCVVPVPSAPIAEIDGYALRSQATEQASTHMPASLPVVDHIERGMQSDAQLAGVEAVAIARGAALPSGYDSVIDAQLIDGRIAIDAPVTSGTGVVAAGAVLASGAEVLADGVLVGDREVAALVAAGCARVLVHPRVRTSVVTVGNDLCDISRVITNGLRPDAVSAMLTTSCLQAGSEAFRGGPVPDDVSAIAACVQDQLVRSDLIVVSVDIARGGSEPAELIGKALADADCTDIDFCQIDPGGWVGVGTVGEDAVPIVVLDATVLAAFVAFEIVVRPMLLSRAGRSALFRPVLRGKATAGHHSPSGTRSFWPATATTGPSGVAVTPAPATATPAPFWLFEANTLMIVSESLSGVGPGDDVTVIRLDRE